jgi:hypothetical protein
MRASGGRGGSGGAAGGGGTGAPVVGAIGGYDPNLYSRLAAARTVAGSGVIPEFSSVGPGSRGLSSEQRDEKNDPTAWGNLSDAQKANYYANNPTMAKFVQGGQKLFGYTTLGGLQKFLDPEFVQNQELIARGITPNATSEINTGNTAQDPMQRQELARQLGLLQTPVSDAAMTGGFTPAPVPVAVTSPVTYSPITTTELPSSDNYSNEGYSRGGGGGYGGPSNGGENGGWGSRDAGGLAKGGQVSTKHLQGPNPAGPDQGYGALKAGEFVINDKAVKKYGIELMNAINSGKISKGKLRGLLEM